MPMCVLFVTSTSGIVFNQSGSAVTDHTNSKRQRVLPSFIWRTPATKRPYSLYLLCWVNTKSERKTKINFCNGCDSNPQPLDRQTSVLPLVDRLPPFCLLPFGGQLCTIVVELHKSHYYPAWPWPSFSRSILAFYLINEYLVNVDRQGKQYNYNQIESHVWTFDWYICIFLPWSTAKFKSRSGTFQFRISC